jgi:hypothetical protein
MIFATLLGPVCGAITLWLKPLNPYDNLYAKKQGISTNGIKNDPLALAFCEQLKSSAARWYVMKLACILSLSMTALALLFGVLQGGFDLSFDSRNLLLLILTWPMSLGIESIFLLRWATKQLHSGTSQ